MSLTDWQVCIENRNAGFLFSNNPFVSEIPEENNLKMKTLAYLVKESTGGPLKRLYRNRDGLRGNANLHHSQNHYMLAGEMKDVPMSPNDEIIFSFHADVDRNSTTWAADCLPVILQL